MTNTITLVGDDKDLSDLYGIVDYSKRYICRSNRDIVQDWLTEMSNMYRSCSKGYNMIFKGENCFIMKEICEVYLAEHNNRENRSVEICKEIISVIQGDVKQSVVGTPEEIKRLKREAEARAREEAEAREQEALRERRMLQDRINEGNAWDTGMDDDSDAWHVDATDPDNTIPY